LRERGAKLAQALLVRDDTHLAAPLERNGFDHITSLWYLRHDLELPVGPFSTPQQLTYVTYKHTDARLFRQTLARTYEQTQDCPEVNGVRTLDEIVEGHRSQGTHDTERWWLALAAGRPVGVLLLTDVPEWDGWDVSYVGVVPEVRRRGLGRELMCKALFEARTAEVSQLTLSVDARNQPACELYRRLGFEIYDEREVYLAIWR
jgi:ribosomal protein S18 acetylase RimI-like enzyme